MSMISAPVAAPATLPASRRNMLIGVNVAGLIRSFMPAGMDNDAVIKPRTLSLSHETARAAVGAGVTAKSLYSGLAYLTLAFAHGQGSVDQLTKGAPAFVSTALAASCSCFKYGAGNVRLADLTTAMESATKAMLALAAPAKATKAAPKAIAAPGTIDATATEEKPTIDANGRALVHSLAYGHEAHEESILAADAARINAPFMAVAVQRIADRERVEILRTKEPEISAMLGALMAQDAGKAEMLIRAAAARLGYTLVAMELPKAA